MDFEGRQHSFRLDELSKRGVILVFVVFVVVFFVGLGIGYGGPQVFINIEEPHTNVTEILEGSMAITDRITKMQILNSELKYLVYLSLTDIDNHGISKTDVKMLVSLVGRHSVNDDPVYLITNSSQQRTLSCPEGNYWCDPLYLIDESVLLYAVYDVSVFFLNVGDIATEFQDIKAEFIYVDMKFFQFELTFRYFYMCLALIISVLFTTVVHMKNKFQGTEWAQEQKWTAAILYALIGYNNPFFAGIVTIDTWVFPFLNVVLIATYLAVLLLALLVFTNSHLNHINDVGEESYKVFYVPKFVLVGAIWAFAVAIYLWEDLHKSTDPASPNVQDLPQYNTLIIIFAVLMGIYLFSLLHMLVSIIKLSYFAKVPHQKTTLRFKMVYVLSFMVIGVTIGGLLGDGAGFIDNTPQEFMSFFTLYNLYSWTLAFVFWPGSRTLRDSTEPKQNQRVALREDAQEEGGIQNEEPMANEQL